MLNENVKLWGSSMVPWCGYTDDLILFMQDIHLMQRATTIFDEVFTNYGLCINVSKTESMSLNSTELKYIDSFISQNKPNMGEIEINHRIQMAYAKFATMTNLIQNSKIHLNTRVKVLNSFVRSRLTYSCKNQNLTVGQFEKLDVTYRSLVRKMIRGGFKSIGDNDEYFRYKLNNLKIHAICCTSDVSNFIRKQQKNYAGHLVRRHIEHCEKQLMFKDNKYHRTGRVAPSGTSAEV